MDSIHVFFHLLKGSRVFVTMCSMCLVILCGFNHEVVDPRTFTSPYIPSQPRISCTELVLYEGKPSEHAQDTSTEAGSQISGHPGKLCIGFAGLPLRN